VSYLLQRDAKPIEKPRGGSRDTDEVSWRIRIVRRQRNLRFVRQAVFALVDAIYPMPVGRCEYQQAWFNAKAVSVMDSTKVSPNVNGVGFTVLSVRLEAADALQVHPSAIGALIGWSVFGWSFTHPKYSRGDPDSARGDWSRTGRRLVFACIEFHLQVEAFSSKCLPPRNPIAYRRRAIQQSLDLESDLAESMFGRFAVRWLHSLHGPIIAASAGLSALSLAHKDRVGGARRTDGLTTTFGRAAPQRSRGGINPRRVA
jgi:hypothetical protein